MRARHTLLQGVGLLLVLLLFFTGVELMGASFALMGKGTATALVRATSDPFVGLFIGILATSLVQSSSTVTSIVVALVAGGGLGIEQAIPIVMGANIGTSVTSTVVSFGSVTRPEEFRRAMAGATVHDFFNLLAVGVLFPLELFFQVLSRPAAALANALQGLGGAELFDPLEGITGPLVGFVIELTGESGLLALACGLVLLFLALRGLVALLQKLFLERSEQLLGRYVFDRPAVALLVGMGLTVAVQSSSLTTSLTVPLVGAGLLTVAQIYPFVLGANMGTTMTAVLAALALDQEAALTVAFAHFTFNVLGFLVFLPVKQLRAIPIWLAEKLGEAVSRNRGYAAGYVAAVFIVVPLGVIFATRGTNIGYEAANPGTTQERTTARDSATRRPVQAPPDTLEGSGAGVQSDTSGAGSSSFSGVSPGASGLRISEGGRSDGYESPPTERPPWPSPVDGPLPP